MGNTTPSSSARMEHMPLAPQLRFPRVTATLRVPFGVFAAREPLAIVDEETGDVAFQLRAARSVEGAADAKPLMLLDKNAVPVAALEGYPVGEDYAMYVAQRPMATAVGRGLGGSGGADAAPAEWNESRVLCYVQANTRPMEKRMLIELEDPVTREPLQVRVEGSWPKHEAIFWLHRGRQCECVARVYVDPHVRQILREAGTKRKQQNATETAPPSDTTEQDPPSLEHYYCVGIAPGVDMALIVLACAAMDGELAKKASGEKVVVPTDDPVTKMLALRHYCTGHRNRTHSRTFITAGFVMGT